MKKERTPAGEMAKAFLAFAIISGTSLVAIFITVMVLVVMAATK